MRNSFQSVRAAPSMKEEEGMKEKSVKKFQYFWGNKGCLDGSS
jgi:hypothetical protein